MRRITGLALACGAAAAGAPGQVSGQSVPGADGERMEYGVVVGGLRLGHAQLAFESTTLRTQPVLEVSLSIVIDAAFLDYDDELVSWISTEPALRPVAFERRLAGSEDIRRRFWFDHADLTFRAEDHVIGSDSVRPVEGREGSGTIPADALDEIAALSLMRTLELTPGDEYRFPYFDEALGPIVFDVIGREQVRVPEGRYETLVIAPIIPALDIFRADRDARIYVTDDERRIIVKMTTRMKVGTMVLYLRDYDAGAPRQLTRTHPDR